jgi:hypothetical protein
LVFVPVPGLARFVVFYPVLGEKAWNKGKNRGVGSIGMKPEKSPRIMFVCLNSSYQTPIQSAQVTPAF